MARIEAIIYAEHGADPSADRIVRSNAAASTTFVAVPDMAVLPAVAADLVANEGVELLELCGGIGPLPAAAVIEAVGDRVPVGVCTFGVESVTGAADFRSRAESGEPIVAAFLFLHAGSDPVSDRVVTDPGGAKTFFVPIADEADAADVAASLVADEGAELVELYRGFSPETVAEVIRAVDGRVPVGAVLFPRSHAPAAVGHQVR